MLANLCRGKPLPSFEAIKNALPALAKCFLNFDSEDIITDIAWAFSYVSDSKVQDMELITSLGILPRLV